jgi:hypothetical protein
MNVSLERKRVKRNSKAQKTSMLTIAVSSKEGAGKETSAKERKKRCRKNLKKKLDVTSSEENTDINNQNICDDNEDVDTEADCEKCFICEEFGKDGELWYRCTSCGISVHAECSG